MSIINITESQDGDTIVLHFQTDAPRINAYTLASTIVAIADAAKEANSAINHGFDIEIVVEGFSGGSFRVSISAIYESAKNLFSAKGALTAIICSIIAAGIYQKVFHKDVKVIINTDEVIIEQGDNKIIVPRNIYDATQEAEKNPKFRSAITKTFEAVARDEQIEGIAMVQSLDSPPPKFVITRDDILKAALPSNAEPDYRILTERAELYIVKAILESGNRKWEFRWRGFKIVAPVKDKGFHERFRAHKVTIAPGTN